MLATVWTAAGASQRQSRTSTLHDLALCDATGDATMASDVRTSDATGDATMASDVRTSTGTRSTTHAPPARAQGVP